MSKFSDLLGKTLTKVVVKKDEILFTSSDRCKYKQYHQQDCCENVEVEDICGDIADIIGSPILVAEESSGNVSDDDESRTWTFYKIDTVKGGLTIRWLGVSNGYYSESVDFEKIK